MQSPYSLGQSGAVSRGAWAGLSCRRLRWWRLWVAVQVNKIRESLGVVVRNSTAYGLRQPHLQRTRLCQLSDADLDPIYVRQRDALRRLVRQLAKPKLVSGEVIRLPATPTTSQSPLLPMFAHSCRARIPFREFHSCSIWPVQRRIVGISGMGMQVMTGPGLAALVEKMVGALNSREIPTAGSILEHFNRDLVQKVTPVPIGLATPATFSIRGHLTLNAGI